MSFMPVFGKRDRAVLAPEVVQTSSMDCGPAALQCLLAGHGVNVSYGRLREACQTSVDGTSIDTIEDVATLLGIEAEQVMIPRDFIALDSERSFPAMVVVRHADTATHFIVVWARHGNWLQIMDPAVGRRWVSLRRFEQEIFAHHQSVDARDWRAWCETDDFRTPMLSRMARIGVPARDADALLVAASADRGWFPLGALDATVRLVTALVDSRGVTRGKEATAVLSALFHDTTGSGHDIFALVPPDYWSARPDTTNTDPTRQMLRISGGVVLKAMGRSVQGRRADLPPDLAAALDEAEARPLHLLWQMIRADGLARPSLLAGLVVVQGIAVLIQALLFRGMFDVATQLVLPVQRVLALAALVMLTGMIAALDLGLAGQAVRQGRRLELRLRRALLVKLPRLKDRYFQSRPITDMADRNHNIHLVRSVPPLAVQMVSVAVDLALTLVAIAFVAPHGIGWAAAIVACAFALPLMTQPLMNERDLRVRNHGGALHGFFLDALLGLAPIRAHRAQQAVSRQHEGLLVEWAKASRGLIALSLMTNGLQMVICTVLVGAMLLAHFTGQAAVSGTDLLLVFWTLKLPAAADRLSGLARRYPQVRNALLRQMEPLTAPEEAAASQAPVTGQGAATIEIRGGAVVAGGHAILSDIDLHIGAGEHVAIVGKSGAGKSSLLGLLLGWHTLEQGQLLIDGRELTPDRLAGLRLQTGWVDPQVQLWNRSLLDNLTYAVDSRDLGRVRALIDASGLMGVSSRLANGLQTALGEGGGLLSGGEGQRVRLGRALLSDDARLALLDEPFRGLDRAQRHAMLRSARVWWQDATLLCVTHDISETAGFDRVLVIEDGRIVEDGAPADLAARPSRYRALCDAETALRRDMWGAARWRRVQVAEGRVVEGARP